MRTISVFGATGSIGRNTLDLIGRAPGDFRVVALTGGRNVSELAQAARAHRAEIAVTAHPECLAELRDALAGSGIETAAGADAIAEAALRPSDLVMSAIVGAAGLVPGLRAVARGATLALANKESLVCAGPLLMATARAAGARILPVDSEHSAIFQALAGEDPARVARIIITASGGPFREWPAERLARATPDEAAAHPNWSMGRRISVDSASLFNKALEIIETREYFGVDPARIEVLVHPQSIVHALVAHVDGGILAHLGPPDMRHAIGYALNWPERRPLPVAALDLAAVGTLSFSAPDPVRFPALRLAREVMQAGGLAGAAFNAAKEVALDHFLDRRIGFLDMARVVEETLGRVSASAGFAMAPDTLDRVLGMDHLARVGAREIAHALAAGR
jgi:1-deoxy-D-xylulose-5-phosphate reductoisomerase